MSQKFQMGLNRDQIDLRITRVFTERRHTIGRVIAAWTQSTADETVWSYQIQVRLTTGQELVASQLFTVTLLLIDPVLAVRRMRKGLQQQVRLKLREDDKAAKAWTACLRAD